MVESATNTIFQESSLKKQQILSRYASGEIPWKKVAEEIAKVQPPISYTWRHKIILVLSSILLLVIPTWARREN